MRLLIVIPAYNEEKTIAEVLRKVEQVDLSGLGIQKEIVVVDDGSTDGTASTVERGFPNVRLLRRQRRGGKGRAVLDAARESDAQFLIVQDADLEYDPSHYPRLLEPVVTNGARAVYGSRFLDTRYPVKMLVLNYAGNLLATAAVNLLYGSKLTDLMTCYKVVSMELFRTLNMRSRGFDICPELTAKLLKRGVRIVEVPIAYRGRGKKEGKKIVFTDSFYILKALITERFKK